MAAPSTRLRQSRRFPILRIFPPSVITCLRRGYEVSAYYNQKQRAGAWQQHRRLQAELVVLPAKAVFHIRWRTTRGRWRQRELRGAQVCFIPAGVIHECRLEAEAELLVLYIERRALRRVARRRLRDTLAATALQHDRIIWHMTWALRELFAESASASASLVDRIGGGLAERLIDRLQHSAATPVTKGRQLSNLEADRVFQFMETNIKYDIHVDDFSKLTGHTPEYFSVLFKNKTRQSPYQYLKELRMLKAHSMIMTGDYRLKEVALEVGYTNLDYFGAIFHKYWHYSARELLAQVRQAARNHRG